MEIVCPNCAMKFPVIAGVNDADARRVASILGDLPPRIAPLMIEYLTLFKPRKSGLTWRRIHTLLTVLVDDVKHGQITRNGRAWVSPDAHWQIALQQMLDRRHKLDLPMKNHGYLYDIIAGLGNQVEAEQEKKIEQRRRDRVSVDVNRGRTPGDTEADIRHFKGLLASCSSDTKPQIEKQVKKLERELLVARGADSG